MSQFLKMNNSITPINLAELNNSLYYLSNENSVYNYLSNQIYYNNYNLVYNLPNLCSRIYSNQYCSISNEKQFKEELNDETVINDKINKEINQKSNEKESLFDIENYNAYVQLNKKNMISQRIKSSKKLFKCTYPGCLKMYSAPYNLKIHYRSHIGERPFKCSFLNCQRSFYDQGNLKYHIKTAHYGERKKPILNCNHTNCKLKFKTKKQKINHHNKLEKECLSERNALIKLASRYKNLYNAILNYYNIKESVINSSIHQSLKDEFEKCLKNCYDECFFVSKLGDKFEICEKK